MFRKLLVAGFVALVLPAVAQADTFRVNYRSNAAAPWQWYTTTGSRAQANAQAVSLQQEGYQSEVVTIQTTARPFTTYTNTLPGVAVTGGTSNWYGTAGSGYGAWGWHRNWHHGWHHGVHHGVAHHGGHRHHTAHRGGHRGHGHDGHHGGHHR